MDSLTQEILETIEFFRRRGKRDTNAETGKACRVITFDDPVTRFFSYIEIPNWQFIQPAAAFEKKHGISGISQNWALPEGLSAEDLEIYTKLLRYRTDITAQTRIVRMKEVCDALLELNPSLKSIKCNLQELDTLHHIILGVTSALNKNDIEHFINKSDTAARYLIMTRSSEYKNLRNIFTENSTKVETISFGWILSPQTLSLIKDTFTQKPKGNPPAIGF